MHPDHYYRSYVPGRSLFDLRLPIISLVSSYFSFKLEFGSVVMISNMSCTRNAVLKELLEIASFESDA